MVEHLTADQEVAGSKSHPVRFVALNQRHLLNEYMMAVIITTVAFGVLREAWQIIDERGTGGD